jgi:hypothetical protein
MRSLRTKAKVEEPIFPAKEPDLVHGEPNLVPKI